MPIPVTRPACVEDAPAIARVHVDTWRTTYEGIVPDEHLANLNLDLCREKWVEHLSNRQSGERTYVAEDASGNVVAFVSGGVPHEPLEDCDGEIYNLYVLKPFQSMGIGRVLLAQIAQYLANKGCSSMVLWVLKENPACRFYERLGGTPVAEKIIEIGGKPPADVAYLWRDLAPFIRDAHQLEGRLKP